MTDYAEIIPVNAHIEHTGGEDCVCGPNVEFAPDEHGDYWIITHRSLDGREAHE